MNEAFTLTTPALLFSAISLILLAYTNRFVAYTSVVRTLYAGYKENPNHLLKGEIDNLKNRLYLIRLMQMLGVASLFLCVITMFLIFVGNKVFGAWVFGAALLALIASLGISMWEIQISVKSLEIHLSELEKEEV